MPTGTGLNRFQAEFPDRFVDVGIAEQHAVALATGIALGGSRPVVAIYATFLQRAFDQIVHDAAQNDQPVLIGVDRAGLVGEDGTSHQGMFSYAAHRQVPNLVIAAPKDEQELRSLVRTALAQDHPFAVNYPRDAGFGVPERAPEILPVGRGEVLREGGRSSSSASGRSSPGASRSPKPWRSRVGRPASSTPASSSRWTASSSWTRPAASGSSSRSKRAPSIGGFGSAVLEVLEEARLADPAYRDVALRIVGIPGDRFVDHGSVGDLRALTRLDTAGILGQVRETLALLRARPAGAPGETASTPSLA